MNSSIIKVSEILSTAKIISSVGFSSGYNFDYSSAEIYFDDFISGAKHPTPVFSGILIIENKNDCFMVVDGIQRLTTISLLLCALCETYSGTSSKNEDAKNKIYQRFLMNEDKPKLKLSGQDKIVYEKILLSQSLTQNEKDSNLYQAYFSFLNKVKEYKITGTELFNMLSKIQFMVVYVDKSEVSTRELYQVLNNNKKESQVNLIYDFISQKDEKAGEILLIVGKKFKNSYLFETFLKDFLLTRIDAEVHDKKVLYNNFKNYYYKLCEYKDILKIVTEIEKYSKYYLDILNANFEDEAVKEQISILNNNEGKDTYPYLMEVLDDLENGHIDTTAFLNILMMVNLFIKNRQDISIPNVNIDFASLSKELNKMLVLKDYVPEFLYENKLTINEINNLSNLKYN